jgi:trans-2,3-dihydro-3-hydroxyanthranilate isomerase
MGRKIFQVDVFTDRMFGGNPLAVFPEPGDLEEAVHLKIAREMNLSETTFVYPPENPEADFRIRIFTPGKEIPFAGHPTLGTAHILWETGKIAATSDSVVLEMDAGLIKVSKKQKNLFMEQPIPSFEDTVKAIDRVAEALSINPGYIDSRFPIQVVSTGFPALYVPLMNLDALRRVELNLTVLREVLGSVDMIYVFTGETLDSSSTVHSRAFAPFIGIPEDPATGSAGGALGAYLVHHKVIENLDPSAIVIEQGFEMDRPSHILVSVEEADEEIRSIQVGGQAITVLEGNLRT